MAAVAALMESRAALLALGLAVRHDRELAVSEAYAVLGEPLLLLLRGERDRLGLTRPDLLEQLEVCQRAGVHHRIHLRRWFEVRSVSSPPHLGQQM